MATANINGVQITGTPEELKEFKDMTDATIDEKYAEPIDIMSAQDHITAAINYINERYGTAYAAPTLNEMMNGECYRNYS